MINLTLPYPPSGNHMWRKGQGRTYLGDRARGFYRDVQYAVMQQGKMINLDMPVTVECRLYPPDNRRRDLDNAWKVLADSLTRARVWQDDHLVRRLHLIWQEPAPGGRVEITIAPHDEKITS